MDEFDEYIKQGEGTKYEKVRAWRAAIGLQQVDGLKTSDYLIDTARKHIEGDITIDKAKALIDSYYRSKDTRVALSDNRTEEADKVAARITELLSEQTFNFSPIGLLSIHKRLFEGIYKLAGKTRDYNISKNEWVLRGKSVDYTGYTELMDTLEYELRTEKTFSYEGLSTSQAILHLAHFISYLWQIHPFCEGNTRTTAVFSIKYLRTLGFPVDNDTFSNNSWYFRNALVRANFNDLSCGIHETTEYLERFLYNLLLGTNYELMNRDLIIPEEKSGSKGCKDIVQSATADIQSATNNKDNTEGFASKCQIGTLNCTLEEMSVLQQLKNNPRITQKELAKLIGKSERTVKRITANLVEKSIIVRKNGKKDGYWEILPPYPNK